MRSLITIPCACGNQIRLEISGSTLPKTAKCADCGAEIYLIEPLGNVVTLLPMARPNRNWRIVTLQSPVS